MKLNNFAIEDATGGGGSTGNLRIKQNCIFCLVLSNYFTLAFFRIPRVHLLSVFFCL